MTTCNLLASNEVIELTSANSPSATSLTCSACVSWALTFSRSLDILDRAVLVYTTHVVLGTLSKVAHELAARHACQQATAGTLALVHDLLGCGKEMLGQEDIADLSQMTVQDKKTQCHNRQLLWRSALEAACTQLDQNTILHVLAMMDSRLTVMRRSSSFLRAASSRRIFSTATAVLFSSSGTRLCNFCQWAYQV